MQDLNGKKALILGMANKRSIAFSVAESLHKHGVKLAVTYQPMDKDRAEEKIKGLCEPFAPEILAPLDVTNEDSVKALFSNIEKQWGGLDILIHSVASAKREELAGRFSEISREGFLFAQEVSSYSLIQMTRAALPLMKDRPGSIVTLTYIGAERVSKNYNVMGAAKAALEANVRYLSMELGPEKIRVNAVSAGPIRTLSASGVKDFLDLLHASEERSPLKRNVTQEEVANAVTFLASEMSSGITGQTLYVDSGYNISG